MLSPKELEELERNASEEFKIIDFIETLEILAIRFQDIKIKNDIANVIRFIKNMTNNSETKNEVINFIDSLIHQAQMNNKPIIEQLKHYCEELSMRNQEVLMDENINAVIHKFEQSSQIDINFNQFEYSSNKDLNRLMNFVSDQIKGTIDIEQATITIPANVDADNKYLEELIKSLENNESIKKYVVSGYNNGGKIERVR